MSGKSSSKVDDHSNLYCFQSIDLQLLTDCRDVSGTGQITGRAGRDELLSSRNFRESYIEGCQRDGTNHWPRSNTENEIKRTNDSKVEKENQASKKYK